LLKKSREGSNYQAYKTSPKALCYEAFPVPLGGGGASEEEFFKGVHRGRMILKGTRGMPVTKHYTRREKAGHPVEGGGRSGEKDGAFLSLRGGPFRRHRGGGGGNNSARVTGKNLSSS